MAPQHITYNNSQERNQVFFSSSVSKWISQEPYWINLTNLWKIKKTIKGFSKATFSGLRPHFAAS